MGIRRLCRRRSQRQANKRPSRSAQIFIRGRTATNRTTLSERGSGLQQSSTLSIGRGDSSALIRSRLRRLHGEKAGVKVRACDRQGQWNISARISLYSAFSTSPIGRVSRPSAAPLAAGGPSRALTSRPDRQAVQANNLSLSVSVPSETWATISTVNAYLLPIADNYVAGASG